MVTISKNQFHFLFNHSACQNIRVHKSSQSLCVQKRLCVFSHTHRCSQSKAVFNLVYSNSIKAVFHTWKADRCMNNIVAVETEDSRRLFIGFEPPFRPCLLPTDASQSECVCVCVCACACESILFTSAQRWITHSHLSNASCVTSDDNLDLQNDLQNRECSKARCSCIPKNLVPLWSAVHQITVTKKLSEEY